MSNSKLKSDAIDNLFKVILKLENEQECYDFFEDLCTVKELISLGQRLEVAKLLDDNVTYQQIAENTGASTATISRISRSLTYGADGYKNALAKLKDN